MPRWGATNKLPRDENGWRIPTEGTKSRRIYDALKAGRSPDDIQVEMAPTTLPSSVLSIIASLKPYEPRPIAAKVARIEDRNLPEIDRNIPAAEPEPPFVKGSRDCWWAYVANGWGAFGRSPKDAVYNLLTWGRPPWSSHFPKPAPTDFRIIDTSALLTDAHA